MTDTLSYEQPLNERIRGFLRLEKLFQQFSHHHRQGSVWSNPIALNILIDILGITTRSDVKLEVLKELERQHLRLESLAKRPDIDQGQLNSILKNLKERINEMQQSSGQLGNELHAIELINTVKQKTSLPGGVCDFDLPAFKFWLHRDEKLKQDQIETWFEPFRDLDRSVQLILDVLRHSAEASDENAPSGFFQKSMDTNQAYQLLRIQLPVDVDYYPEISAGKHRFSVRFMTNDDPAHRPEQCKHDVSFKLQMCVI